MIRKLLVLLLVLTGSPVWADDAIYFLGTYFSPNGRSDIFQQNRRETTFDVDDLNDFAVTGGYDHFIGEYVNVGGSVTYYKEDAVGRDRAFQQPNGGPVIRDFRLEMMPVEFNARVLPLGRDVVIIPYLGGGVGLYFWKYEEEGDFVVDRQTSPRIVTGSASSDGRTFGFHVHGGIQIPLGGSTMFTVEVKHIYVDADLDRREFDPAFEPIDLSAILYSAGLTFGF